MKLGGALGKLLAYDEWPSSCLTLSCTSKIVQQGFMEFICLTNASLNYSLQLNLLKAPVLFGSLFQ